MGILARCISQTQAIICLLGGNGPGQAHRLHCFCQLERIAKGSHLLPSAATMQDLISSQLAAGVCVCSQVWVQLPLSGLLSTSVSPVAPMERAKAPGRAERQAVSSALLSFFFLSHSTSYFLLIFSPQDREGQLHASLPAGFRLCPGASVFPLRLDWFPLLYVPFHLC